MSNRVYVSADKKNSQKTLKMSRFRPETTYRYTGETEFLNTAPSTAPSKFYPRQMVHSPTSAVHRTYTRFVRVRVRHTYYYYYYYAYNILPEHRHDTVRRWLTLYSTLHGPLTLDFN